LHPNYCKGVLFLKFEKEDTFQSKTLNIIKIISAQLGITLINKPLIENILASLPVENDASTPSKAEEPVNMKIIGNSAAIQKVRSLIRLVSDTDSSVSELFGH